MRRTVAPLFVLLGLLLMPTGVAATGPVAACPNDNSGYFLVDQQGWWDRTVAGTEAEGIHVYVGGDPANGFTPEFEDFAVSMGFDGAQALYDYVWVTQWIAIDKNGDLMVCMKDRPHTPGNPAYFFNGVDNTAH